MSPRHPSNLKSPPSYCLLIARWVTRQHRIHPQANYLCLSFRVMVREMSELRQRIGPKRAACSLGILRWGFSYSWKLIYTRNHDVLPENYLFLSIHIVHIRQPSPTRETGSTDIFATSQLHFPNGQFILVVGDGEYVIYTSLDWRNKHYLSRLGT